MAKGNDKKLRMIIAVLLVLLVAVSTVLAVHLNNKSKSRSVSISKEAWRQMQYCIRAGGAIQHISPRVCVSYKNVKGIDHSVKSFDDCAKGKEAFGDINPPMCTMPDGRIFLGKTMHP